MNRRLFLASLPFLPSAVKAAMAEPDWKCVITYNVKAYTLTSISWDTMVRRGGMVQFYENPRDYFAPKLARQLAMPVPNLP